MSKAKKQSLTQEELLAQALVPESEQPYEVPGNWVWVRLRNAVSACGDKFNDFENSEGIKYVGLEHLEKDVGVIGYGDASVVKSLKNAFSKGDLLYGKLRPYLNKHDIADFDGICSTDIVVFKALPQANIKLINYYFNTDRFLEYAISNSKGINLPRISPDVILNAAFPLPPLAEQQRIVERIESLFEKLDRAKELAQNALDSFVKRKAAILHKAFTGELTAKWREENGVGLENWRNVTTRDVCGFITKGETPTQYVESIGEIPFLKVYNIRDNKLDFDYNPAFIPKEIHNNRLKRSIVYPNDVIMNIVGPPLQKVAIVTNQYNEWNINQAIAIFRPKEKIISKYLYYCLIWEDTLKTVLSDVRGVVGQSNISLEQCRNLSIPLPALPEQCEIVRILDSLLDNEQRARELCDVIKKIDLMKKAILARAFRGELGTNDPTEESAARLLKNVL